MIVNCKEIRDKHIEKLKERDLSECKAVFIQVGDNQASNVYVRNKLRLCEELNIQASHIKLDEDISEKNLVDLITMFNKNKCISGIMVQLPLPSHINEENIINAIDWKKDIDGFTNVNKGKLMVGDNSAITACTPSGIMLVIEEQGIDLNGKNVVIVGRSNIVGKPLAQLMINSGATVTVCNSKTDKEVLLNHIANSDIFVSAIGRANYFNEDFCKFILNKNLKKCFAIDVGINRDEDGKLCGDISKDMYDYFGMATPSPGGIGLLTVAEVIRNLVKCYDLSLNN
ncbi:MAG: bifunctional 5,10-methylenetetrahydrofolate dehydrogenase/5,10-methenyltetrahydrofolate cyclohydrolase [Clostridium sp.]